MRIEHIEGTRNGADVLTRTAFLDNNVHRTYNVFKWGGRPR